MALDRSQEGLSRGVRRTQLENSFGVVKTAASSWGQIGGKVAETAEKITLFQADIMDKEWQNDFDTQSKIFLTDETNKELTSANPDLIGLQQKLLTYKDKILQESPQRFQNYVKNKLDLNISNNLNLVKDYTNNLKYVNLFDETKTLQQDYLDEANEYFTKLIKNNPGDLEYINSNMENYMLNIATPNINRIAKNYESLNQLQPLKTTPQNIADEVRNMQIGFTSIKFETKVKSILSTLDFENTPYEQLAIELNAAEETINDLIQDFVQNPESRDISNLSDKEVSQLEKNFNEAKENFLGFESKKIEILKIAENKMIQDESKLIIDTFKNNPTKSINSNPSSILEIISNTKFLSEDTSQSIQTLNSAIRSTNIHKALKVILERNDGVYPDQTTLLELVNNYTNLNVSPEEVTEYSYIHKGGNLLSTYDYMDIYKNIVNTPSWGKHGDGKSIDQVMAEKSSMQDIAVFEDNLRNGIYPPDLKQYLSNIDLVISKPELTDMDLKMVNDAFNLMQRIQGNNDTLLYEGAFGEAPLFYQWLKDSKGILFENTPITEIGSLKGMVEEYKQFRKTPYDKNDAYDFLKSNDLNFNNVEYIQSKIVDDAQSQFGFEAVGKYLANKFDYLSDFIPFVERSPDYVKTTTYTDLFNIKGINKYMIGLTAPILTDSNTFSGTIKNMISIDPIVEAQLSKEYIGQLNKLGVDFSLIGQGKDSELINQIKKVNEKAFNLTIRKLRDDGFGMSKYEKKGEGYTLVHNPLESKMFYDNEKDNDLVIATSFFNRIKDMESTLGLSKMMEDYPDLYYNNFNTNQEEEVNFDLNRAFELAITKNGIYLTKEPGTEVYRFNLDESIFGSGNRFELDGNIDEEQFFVPGDDLVVDGKIVSHKAIFSGAIQKYLEKDSFIVNQLKLMNVDTEVAKSILYSLYYPGVKFLTTEDDILDYLERLTVSPFGKIE